MANFSSLPTTFCKCNIQAKYAEIAIKNTDSNAKNCAYQTILQFQSGTLRYNNVQFIKTEAKLETRHKYQSLQFD